MTGCPAIVREKRNPPPWFLPGAEIVWNRIVETERALRGVVRAVYAARFGETAERTIEEALPEGARETLARALRRRPAGAELSECRCEGLRPGAEHGRRLAGPAVPGRQEASSLQIAE